MDFILEHNDDPIPDATSSAQPQSEPINVDDDEDDAAAFGLQPGDASQAGSDAVAEARVSRTSFFDRRWRFYVQVTCQSVKCSQCGKTFKNTALANFHAEKSGHDQFEESTEEVRFVSLCCTNNFIDEGFFYKDQTSHGRGEKPKAG
jgi:hypothetical protein